LSKGAASIASLAKVQARREFPTRVTQSFQVIVQNMVIRRILGLDKPFSPPLPFRLLARFPSLRNLPARFIGVGVRPEHIQTPDAGVSRAPVTA
jgi:hypothetical protein